MDPDDDEPARKKRTRRQANASAPVKRQQTRFSSRIAKKPAPKNRFEDEDGKFDQQDDNDAGQRSGHGHPGAESYDIYDVFQGRSKRRHGMEPQNNDALWMLTSTQVVAIARLTWPVSNFVVALPLTP